MSECDAVTVMHVSISIDGLGTLRVQCTNVHVGLQLTHTVYLIGNRPSIHLTTLFKLNVQFPNRLEKLVDPRYPARPLASKSVSGVV